MGASARNRPLILISTDDMELYLLLDHIFRAEAFTSKLVGSAEEIRSLLRDAPPPLLIVDCRSSAEAFRDFCATLRQDKAAALVPILALVAHSAEREYVSSIGPEVAEIFTRPIWPGKLVQSVRAALARRSGGGARIEVENKPIQYADVEMDLASYRVWRGGREIHLSLIEFKLLRQLLEHPEQVVTRREMRIAAWPPNIHVGPRTIDVHVGRLRKALSAAAEANLIRTVRSVGWALSTSSPDKSEPQSAPAAPDPAP
ncbi:MAG: response regulator transcription factor [Dongiaceae bacterium]